LALLMGLTWLTFQAVDPSFGDGRLAIFVGFVLLAASAAGTVAGSLGIPRVTGFIVIVIGIVAGPSLLGLLPEQAVDDLQLIDDVAATPVTISPLVPFLDELAFGGVLAVALLLGVWAANSSPDLTVAVIEERRADGLLAEVILGVTIVKDVVVIVLFTLTVALVAPLLDPEQALSREAVRRSPSSWAARCSWERRWGGSSHSTWAERGPTRDLRSRRSFSPTS
jgi:hypothetical protein